MLVSALRRTLRISYVPEGTSGLHSPWQRESLTDKTAWWTGKTMKIKTPLILMDYLQKLARFCRISTDSWPGCMRKNVLCKITSFFSIQEMLFFCPPSPGSPSSTHTTTATARTAEGPLCCWPTSAAGLSAHSSSSQKCWMLWSAALPSWAPGPSLQPSVLDLTRARLVTVW